MRLAAASLTLVLAGCNNVTHATPTSSGATFPSEGEIVTVCDDNKKEIVSPLVKNTRHHTCQLASAKKAGCLRKKNKSIGGSLFNYDYQW